MEKYRERAVDNNSRKLEDGRLNLEGKERQLEKQQLPSNSSSPPPASSSPSHEFSFSVSLQTSSTDKAKTPPSSFTIDLSPADDIFFHGHLLPLHLLSHLSVPPRCSTNSIEGYALPIRDLLSEEPKKESSSLINCKSDEHYQNNGSDTREKAKSKFFSLLGLRWRKRYGAEGQENKEEQNKRKLGFNLSNVLKRYARMVRPFLHFRGKRNDMQLHRQCYSFSGNLSSRKKPELRGRRGEFFSAPVSMRTSPTNSGVLLSTTTIPPSTNDSTMEELQAAIQAAIAHCKNSILKEERLKC